MVTYIVQLSVFLLLFWGVYELFLKKETFFTYNRWYLLLTPIISALLPFLSFNILESYAVEAQQMVQLPAVFIGDPVVQETPNETVSNVTTSISFLEKYAWWLAYGLGVLFSLLVFIKKVIQFQQFRKQGKVSYLNDLKLIEVENSSKACTFFKTIYLGSDLAETEKVQILKHEQVHAQQYHSLDLLFFEILKIAIWFNPVVYLYQRQITNLHEYIADAEATKNSDKKSYYESLLKVAFGSEQISFIHQFFNHSLIKKRILMLQKSKSARAAKFKFLILIPLIFAMLTYVSCSDSNSLTQDSGIETSTISDLSEKDALLVHQLVDELEIMVENGSSLIDIAKTFVIVKEGNIKSEEEYYRFLIFMNLTKNNRDIENRGFDKEEFIEDFDAKWKERYISYQDYVAYRKTQEKEEPKTSLETVPFTAIETVPVFPGCEGLDKDAAKKCLSTNISLVLNENFNSNNLKPYAQKGVNRIYVRFAISKEGTIEDIEARASSPELADEAKRVVALLPKMEPGKQDGEAVNVLYYLPISFQVDEDTSN
ncbi:Signal transducer regulating beta-lactamase production, contains metallopeptidase domain [Mesonia phycicola]|uniref:Signal transducer regulating beta-lactamase production, contains metallopeptidase domain n=1 Tax=Mesonia phycicola TaxID=579105 RepID=A0A1M6B178_9FLAO|nr:M56 family metallopeptidase [Mesonia phycicola]SHI42475.1 Signal transducer regulating beta-lactamase production, contains metallopeptidase domain [Mesonia phycicola]